MKHSTVHSAVYTDAFHFYLRIKFNEFELPYTSASPDPKITPQHVMIARVFVRIRDLTKP